MATKPKARRRKRRPTNGELSDEEKRLVEARSRAAFVQIRVFGDPVLRTPALVVDSFDDDLRQQVERMNRIMVDAPGIGLAAPQIGLLNRVLVYRVGREAPMQALINPAIEAYSDEVEAAEEGCLSIPDVGVEVERSVEIRVKAQNLDGEQIVIEPAEFEARIVQHEVDHLNGILMLNRASKEARRQAMRVLRGEVSD